MRNNFMAGFADEMVKLSSAYTRAIGRLVDKGHFERAKALADKLKELGGPLEVNRLRWKKGLGQFNERVDLGRWIRDLGSPGQERVSTLVVDKKHGLSVRKIRHNKAVTPEGMSGLQGVFQNKDPSIMSKRLGSYIHEGTGRRVVFDEFVPGENGQTLLNKASPEERVKISKFIGHLQGKVKRLAEDSGWLVDDIGPKNIVLRKTENGYRGKLVDFTAVPKNHELAGATKPPINPPSRSEIVRSTFNPDFAPKNEVDAYDMKVDHSWEP